VSGPANAPDSGTVREPDQANGPMSTGEEDA
jgi:hypothetical protein